MIVGNFFLTPKFQKKKNQTQLLKETHTFKYNIDFRKGHGINIILTIYRWVHLQGISYMAHVMAIEYIE